MVVEASNRTVNQKKYGDGNASHTNRNEVLSSTPYVENPLCNYSMSQYVLFIFVDGLFSSAVVKSQYFDLKSAGFQNLLVQ